MALPILYSYRRCPYAMRARMALHYAKIDVEIREIVLRDKPAHLLQASPKGTVPVLILQNGDVLEQSLDIMVWALTQHDPDGWLGKDLTVSECQNSVLIVENDGEFKRVLDRYKYPERYPEKSQTEYRQIGQLFLHKLEALLLQHAYLQGPQPRLVDVAIFPFIRQFAAVDQAWFEQAPYPALKSWLSGWIDSALFQQVMGKHPVYPGGA